MSDLKTPKQILKDRNIKVDELEQDKPMLLNNILRAMDDFADQYYNWKLANCAATKDSGLHLKRINNSVYCECTEKEVLMLPHSNTPYCAECGKNIKQ